MAIFKCKMCGGNLPVADGTKIVECDFCGTTQTVPNADDEKKTNLFNRANRLRIASEFDHATGIYESIIAEFPEEAEAYWGLCLCKYGIEYVDDPKTAKKIPTCHRTSFESILNYSNYHQAIACSDTLAKNIYESEAAVIDALQKDILSIVNKEEPFDVFICYKETDEFGSRTVDSVLAQDIYDQLTDKGFKVFFARITLEDKLGQEYEPYIFAALNSAKVMLAIGTNSEYYNAVWVKNEWSRYLSLMQRDRSKTLVPCYRNIDPCDMPQEFKNLQGQDMGKLGFIQDLTRGITKIIHGSAEKPTVTASAPASALTKRGYFFLEDGDFRSADEYFDKALDENPEDSKAYAGKVLAGFRLKDVTEIDNSFVNLYENKNFERAIRFASGADKTQLEAIKENADKKWLVKCLTVELKNVAKAKETAEILDKVKKLAATGTIEAYEEIVSIYTVARNRQLSSDFTVVEVNSYRRQRDILCLLYSDYEEYTLEDILKSKYFSGARLASSVLQNDVEKMMKAGSVEKGSTPDTYCVAGSTELRMQLRKEREDKENEINGKAIAYIQEGKYREAAYVLGVLGDNENARSLLALGNDVIAVGANHTVGLKSDGTVVATGGCLWGQCNVRDWTNIDAVAAGMQHTVGLKSDGTVIAVGNNSEKQCDVKYWCGIIAIAAGSNHTVGLKSNGTVVAVGSNIYKQCNVRDWTDIVAIAAGAEHTVGLKADGTVVTTNVKMVPPRYVSDWTDIDAMAAGNGYTVGLKSDGTAVAFLSSTASPHDYGQYNVSGWTDIVAVAARTCHTVGLKSDGTVVAVGKNDFDQCDVSEWKLFDGPEGFMDAPKRRAERARIKAEREAEEARIEAERCAQRLADLRNERPALEHELANLKGLFSGKRRREIEDRLAEIERELNGLSANN